MSTPDPITEARVEDATLVDDLSATVEWLKRTRNYVDADRVMRAIAALRRPVPEPPTDDEHSNSNVLAKVESTDDEREALVHLLFDQVPEDWDENDIGILADGLAEYLLSDENVERVASAYATHVTGYSMRDGGYTYTCRCGWSESGEDAQSSAQKHRARAALQAVLGKEQP